MSLNIKNPRTTSLVRTLAERTGMSQTKAVEVAVLERLASLDREAATEAGMEADGTRERREAAAALLRRIRGGLNEDDRRALRGAEAELYDGTGLPR